MPFRALVPLVEMFTALKRVLQGEMALLRLQTRGAGRDLVAALCALLLAALLAALAMVVLTAAAVVGLQMLGLRPIWALLAVAVILLLLAAAGVSFALARLRRAKQRPAAALSRSFSGLRRSLMASDPPPSDRFEV